MSDAAAWIAGEASSWVYVSSEGHEFDGEGHWLCIECPDVPRTLQQRELSPRILETGGVLEADVECERCGTVGNLEVPSPAGGSDSDVADWLEADDDEDSDDV